MAQGKNAVLLLSGGLDSYTAGAMAARDGYELFALTIRYGQVHTREVAAARRVAQALRARRHIELRVIPRHTAEQGGVIEFSVTDNGPGLPEEVIARLYEAFFSTKSDGLGIGLSLCRSIVESHRGRIRAENLYNGPTVIGCRFSFTLPVEAGSASHERSHAEAVAAPPPSPSLTPNA